MVRLTASSMFPLLITTFITTTTEGEQQGNLGQPQGLDSDKFLHLRSEKYYSNTTFKHDILTLLHSEWPKLYGVLAFLSAIRLREVNICKREAIQLSYFSLQNPYFLSQYLSVCCCFDNRTESPRTNSTRASYPPQTLNV